MQAPGLAGGASINVQIKSSTNHIHGEAYETNSNNAIETYPAVFPAGQRLPLLIFDQFSGPIRKDKLFYFLSCDGVLGWQAYSAYATVPKDPSKAGDFSTESSTPIYDPSTGNADGSGRTAFSGSKIPTSRFSAVSQKILPLWPELNLPGLTHFQFRTELFNLTNTPHWWLPGSSVSAPGSFGIITSTDAGYLGRADTDPRLFRLGGKISF